MYHKSEDCLYYSQVWVLKNIIKMIKISVEYMIALLTPWTLNLFFEIKDLQILYTSEVATTFLLYMQVSVKYSIEICDTNLYYADLCATALCWPIWQNCSRLYVFLMVFLKRGCRFIPKLLSSAILDGSNWFLRRLCL